MLDSCDDSGVCACSGLVCRIAKKERELRLVLDDFMKADQSELGSRDCLADSSCVGGYAGISMSVGWSGARCSVMSAEPSESLRGSFVQNKRVVLLAVSAVSNLVGD